ncbi:MAG: hypothetical protein U0452_03175 [Anaerolineae bacterium]
MKRAKILKLCLVFVFALLVVNGLIAAVGAGVDDQGNPNDPAVNERANACYAGGTMDGKCTNELEWQCSWYLIRFETGMISRAEFPAACAGLLPELPSPAAVPTTPAVPTAGCVFVVTNLSSSGWVPNYADFKGGNFILDLELFLDPDCKVYDNSYGLSLAYAPGGEAAALEICQQHGYSQALTTIGLPLEPGIYRCV